jgi:hypothetical protein
MYTCVCIGAGWSVGGLAGPGEDALARAGGRLSGGDAYREQWVPLGKETYKETYKGIYVEIYKERYKETYKGDRCKVMSLSLSLSLSCQDI